MVEVEAAHLWQELVARMQEMVVELVVMVALQHIMAAVAELAAMLEPEVLVAHIQHLMEQMELEELVVELAVALCTVDPEVAVWVSLDKDQMALVA
jgi:hypothetical protein